VARLKQAGFAEAMLWFQCFNFASFVAIKREESSVMSLRQQFDPLFTQLFKDFGQSIQNTALQAAFPALADTYYRKLDEPVHGDLPRWVEVISRTQALVPSVVDLSQDRLLVGQASDLSTELAADWTRLLMQQHPWRKGPFALFGTHIDTEWRSDWKWQRVAPHIAPLQDRVVLDVGCGSGYHVWRMLGAGARCVLGMSSRCGSMSCSLHCSSSGSAKYNL
jgi:tRNA (mo5U34)-methyltransferase